MDFFNLPAIAAHDHCRENRGTPHAYWLRRDAALSAADPPPLRRAHQMAPVKRYAASGCVKAASNWSSAQSISSRVITSGGLTRMVWSWVSLHRRPRRRRASQ